MRETFCIKFVDTLRGRATVQPRYRHLGHQTRTDPDRRRNLHPSWAKLASVASLLFAPFLFFQPSCNQTSSHGMTASDVGSSVNPNQTMHPTIFGPLLIRLIRRTSQLSQRPRAWSLDKLYVDRRRISRLSNTSSCGYLVGHRKEI